MSVPIPFYLTGIAASAEQDSNRVRFKIRCSCGSERFGMFMNNENTAELAKRMGVELPLYPAVRVLKAVCALCGAEHVIFDSRRHGYNGVVTEFSAEALAFCPEFHAVTSEDASITVEIENDESYGAFLGGLGLDYSEEQYSQAYSQAIRQAIRQAFSWITVTAADERGEERIVLDLETG